MAHKVIRTEWRAIALDMSIETSSMEVMTRKGGFQKRPIVRVIFRTADGKEFSGPRISLRLCRSLEKFAAEGPWLREPLR